MKVKKNQLAIGLLTLVLSLCTLTLTSVHADPLPGSNPTRITHQVPGLYENIPTQRSIQIQDGYRIQTTVELIEEYGELELNSDIFNSQGKRVGTFSTTYIQKTKQLVFTSAHLRLRNNEPGPSFVRLPNLIELVPGRGTPTQMFIRLHHMRIGELGLGHNEIQKISVIALENVQVILELMKTPKILRWFKQNNSANGPIHLASLKELKMYVGQQIPQTQIGRYMQDVLTQSLNFCVEAKGYTFIESKGDPITTNPQEILKIKGSQPSAVEELSKFVAEHGLTQILNIGFGLSANVQSCER